MLQEKDQKEEQFFGQISFNSLYNKKDQIAIKMPLSKLTFLSAFVQMRILSQK